MFGPQFLVGGDTFDVSGEFSVYSDAPVVPNNNKLYQDSVIESDTYITLADVSGGVAIHDLKIGFYVSDTNDSIAAFKLFIRITLDDIVLKFAVAKGDVSTYARYGIGWTTNGTYKPGIRVQTPNNEVVKVNEDDDNESVYISRAPIICTKKFKLEYYFIRDSNSGTSGVPNGSVKATYKVF